MTETCIIVIDDEELVHEMIEGQLQSAGFCEHSFSSPAEALSFFEGHQDETGLAIVDFSLPGTSGADVADRLLEKKPNLPIILVTGHSPDTLDPNDTRRFAGILSKPFTRSELTQAVEAALKGERKKTA